MSYYNPLAMYPKSHCANLYPGPGSNPWYPSNYQTPSTAQLFAAGAAAAAGNSDADGGLGAQPPLYYPHMFHQSSSPDWHPESFSTPPAVNGPLLQAAANHSGGGGSGASGHHHHHHHLHHHSGGHQGSSGALNSEHLNDGLHSIPSPPITVSGSEMSSPGGGGGGGGANSASNNNNGLHGVGGLSPHHNMSIRPVPVKSPFEWIKRTSYQNQTNPGEWNEKGILYDLKINWPPSQEMSEEGE